ncbi:hypothetical protein JCM14722_04500 [Pseudodesulfovibrio portus]|uniref:Uncharacterized protein n=1 Tax=Pseudodesulfovibrio portus TaxID=231439 RepID=A0ABM8ANL9_9BACT|nr:hypothetical protein JCM14722_04500 [Pseudodesulfovibrio portus]
MWDACFAEIGLWRNDPSIIDFRAAAHGWHYSFYSYVIFDLFSQWTGIHYRVFFNVITVLSVLGLSCETYWLAREGFHPEREFAFGSFMARHTMLTIMPLAVMVAVVGWYVAGAVGKMTAEIGFAVLLPVGVVLLCQGVSHKAAAPVFKVGPTESLSEVAPPPAGYVAIEAKEYEDPRHVHGYAVNALFHRAYGNTDWMSNGYWRRKMDLGPESLKGMYGDSRGRPVCEDVSGDAYTRHPFELTDFHQEGPFWYWYYYLTSGYSAFEPRLTLVESLPGTHG